MAREIGGVQQGECEYRGITSTFEELTRVYVLQVYQGGKLVRWEASPSPQNPDTETLVAGVFTVDSLKVSLREPPAEIARLRRAAPPAIGVVWRYSTLGAIRITAANEYAVDALAVFRQTIDDFIARMVVTTGPAVLRQGPGPDFPVVERFAAGTVFLRQEGEPAAPGWTYARLPSSQVVGWLENENLRALEYVR
jgi:hypothetical protein